MEVRRIRDEADVEKMIELGAKMHAESRYMDIPYDRAKLAEYGRAAIENPFTWGGFLVEDEEGKVYAMIGGFKAPFYFSSDVFQVTDFFIYVDKSKRGGLAAARCLKALEEWAGNVKAYEIVFGISAGINDETAERFYKGLGYTQVGTLMRKQGA